MKLVQMIEYLRQRQQTVIVICYGILALLVIIDAVPFLVDKEHAHTAIEHLPGFWSMFGLLACLLIIFFSKWLGHAGIMQREDYYHD